MRWWIIKFVVLSKLHRLATKARSLADAWAVSGGAKEVVLSCPRDGSIRVGDQLNVNSMEYETRVVRVYYVDSNEIRARVLFG